MIAMMLSVGLAHAAWNQTAEKHGCTFYKGATEGAVLPLKADCHWAVAPEKLQGLLTDWAAHARYFEGVSTSEVLRVQGATSIVHQVHVASGISDREVVLAMTIGAIPGGKRFSWKIADDQSARQDLGVLPLLDTGSYDVTSDEGGGTHLIYELRYDAGGSVPGFVVRAFQGGGFQDMLGELAVAAGVE